jgi:hypothetical protein
MKHSLQVLLLLIFSSIACQEQSPIKKEENKPLLVAANYEDLVALFKEWRSFEKPPLKEGAPDYTAATFQQRLPKFKELQTKLLSMDTARWLVPQKVDWCVAKAEMNGFDFNHRVLKPWERDPAFYKSVWTERSDVPAHEGPTHHATAELWTYQFPLSSEGKTKLLADLKVIAPLNKQAQTNLTGNAKDLWNTGIRDIRTQIEDLKQLLEEPSVKETPELVEVIKTAIQSTDELAAWLEKEGKNKTGESGIGKENYTWYQQLNWKNIKIGICQT